MLVNFTSHTLEDIKNNNDMSNDEKRTYTTKSWAGLVLVKTVILTLSKKLNSTVLDDTKRKQ